MALPNDKISTTLVANTLGTSSRDVGTLCTHQAINMWSRHKPVQFNTTDPLTVAQLSSVDQGMSIDPISNLSTVQAATWRYARPNGGANNAPYRIGDFRGYDHDSLPFLYVGYPANHTLEVEYNKDLELVLSRAVTSRIGGGMQISDFTRFNMASMHFGVYCRSSTNHAVFKSSANLGSGSPDSLHLTIPKTWLQQNPDATVTHIICTNNFAVGNLSDNLPTAGNAYALPNGAIIPYANRSTTIKVLTRTTPPTAPMFSIVGVSSSLHGTYLPFNNYMNDYSHAYFSQPTPDPLFNYFNTLNYGSIYFKCSFGSSGAVSASQTYIDMIGNYADSSVVRLIGQNGDLYNNNRVRTYSDFNVGANEFFYLGADRALYPNNSQIGGHYFNIPIRTTNLNNNVMTNIYTRDWF